MPYNKKSDEEMDRIEVNEMLRRWDMETVKLASKQDWITEEEAEELRRLLNKVWDGKRDSLSAV